MRFSFTEEQRQMRDALRSSLTESCPSGRVRAAWKTPDATFRTELAEQGILAINLPEDAGGLGLGAQDWVLLVEELGQVAAPVNIVETLATNPTLAAIGASERLTGLDVSRAADTIELASRVGAGDAFVTLEEPGGFALDADKAAGILAVRDGRVGWLRDATWVAETSVDGTRRPFKVDGRFEVVDADATELLDRAALAAAAELVGLSRRMLDLAVEYSKSRRQFGKPIGSFQAVQHHLVDALQRIAFAAPAVYRAAWSVDTNHPNRSVHVSMAKVYASEAALLTARKALQVHGAIGYTFEYDLHMWMKRAWTLSSAWGDVRHHTDRVGQFVMSGGQDA